ncbi:hypothetical protein ACJMK2_008556 [Sinanodonta woodiana]|uniref:EGF-like domain-containing protein n=1 Tax=Sinanodonta woodiana TaxID=1069815 RepID=A0ABD3VLZ3_SINWO
MTYTYDLQLDENKIGKCASKTVLKLLVAVFILATIALAVALGVVVIKKDDVTSSGSSIQGSSIETQSSQRFKRSEGPCLNDARGYRVTADGKKCEDVDECAYYNGGCAHTCVNTDGSFLCRCKDGYRLSGDGHNCLLVNPCELSNGGCDHVCLNNNGVAACSCMSGYRSENMGKSCVDIDECAAENTGCSHACKNTPGSYTCTCSPGYQLGVDGRTCFRDRNDNVCLTEGCVLAAARLQNAMDQTAKPCDDFYTFACGNWVKKHVIPESKASYSTFSMLRDDVSVILKDVLERDSKPEEPEGVKKARSFYKACVNSEKLDELGTSTIMPFIEDLGGWPVLGSSRGGWNGNFNFEDLLVKVRCSTSSKPLIDMSVGQDDKNPDKHALFVDQSVLGMPARDYFLKGRADTVLMEYENYAKSIAIALGANKSTADTDMKEMVDFEIKLANFDWSRYIQGIFSIEGVNITLENEDHVIVVVPAYFEKIFKLIAATDPRVIVNYVMWMEIKGKIFFLPESIRQLGKGYQKALYGTDVTPARWDSCVNTIKDFMPTAVGKLFVDEAFDEEAKKNADELIKNLRESFSEMLHENEWMDAKTKIIAQEKLAVIYPKIGYPADVKNNTAIDEIYKDLQVTEGEAMQSYINYLKRGVVHNLKELRRETDKTRWSDSAATVNAFYSPGENQITFPAGILQPPFYAQSQPNSLNYGGIGYVIGHEMTHGFDDNGRMYDKDGNLHQWWTEDIVNKFKEHAQCIVDQYSNFTAVDVKMHLNGINTQGENIADNGGVREAFRAYKKLVKKLGAEEQLLPGLNYTHEQLFFINSAQVWCQNIRPQEEIRLIRTDPHSLAYFRVIGPLQNSAEFSEVFKCQVGSRMNPQTKCTIW